jgi:Tfp pilus assembly protein PilX
MVQRKRYPRTSLCDEKGMVLVVGLLLIAVLMLLGTTAVMTSTTDMKISTNYKSGSQAFYIAEAGIERARGQLRTDLAGSTTSPQVLTALTNMLTARAGANGTLSNSTNSVNFYAGGAFVTDDLPYIAATSFGGGTYRVYLTNDAKNTGGVTSTTDTNYRVTLTSFGQGPNNSLTIAQQVVEKLVLPPLPGAIVLPGPGVNFQGGNSNASGVDGGVESAVALTSPESLNAVNTNLTDIGRLDNYTCAAPPCITNELATIDPTWTSVTGIENLYNTLMPMANVVVGTPGTTTTLTAAQVGTQANRQIVVVNGNAVLGPVDGAGILIVTGQLTLTGNFNYHGFIMCIGQGSLLRSGGGNGEIEGSVFVAKTRDSSNNLLTSLGTSTFNTSGGGNSDIEYDSSQINMPPNALFVKKSWQQL